MSAPAPTAGAAPRVTVMMAVYNAERYLRESAESALAQTFRDLELLIVYDPSTDRSLEVARALAAADPRVRIIENARKKNVAFVRQLALAEARGELVAVLDADDLALPDRIAVEVELLDRRPDLDLVGTAYDVIDAEGRPVLSVSVPEDSLAIRWRLLCGGAFGHSTVLFRRDAIRAAGGYDEAVESSEDYELMVRLAARGGRFAQLPRPLVKWRSHATSLSRTEPAAAKESIIRTVASSFRRQAGVEIDAAAARTLFRDFPATSAGPRVLALAYRAIERALEAVIAAGSLSAADRARLVGFAADDAFRLARRHPRSYAAAAALVLGAAGRHGVRLPSGPPVVRAALRSVAAAGVLDPWRRLRRWLGR